MVTAPARPFVHSYDPGKDPMELVDTPSGPMERWRADAMLVGETSALTNLIKQVHSDAAETIDDIESREEALAAREEACAARERALGVTAAQVVNFIGRAAALFDKLQEARADQERANEEPIASPPGSDPFDPNKQPEPSLEVEADVTPGPHSPSGELHVVEAKEDLGHPSVTDGDFLRLKHSVTADQAEFAGDLPRPPEFKQPSGDGLDTK